MLPELALLVYLAPIKDLLTTFLAKIKKNRCKPCVLKWAHCILLQRADDLQKEGQRYVNNIEKLLCFY